MNYSWGSREAISGLLGCGVPSERPEAELWMGAHPKAPSLALTEAGVTPLPDLIEQQPDAILGDEVARAFGGELPFLFKVLAAAEPLSIQAHPTREQARRGYEREEAMGVPLDAPERNYRDRNHKPEILCALTPFWALKGFRDPQEILTLLASLECDPLRPHLDHLERIPGPEGLRSFYRGLLTMPEGERRRMISEAAEAARRLRDGSPEHTWMLELHEHYPGDAGLLSPLILNLVELQPGQAMALGAGELHAYLRGTGIELMANSDNVLRGGLTSKHMDVPELLEVVRFERGDVSVLDPPENARGEKIYGTPFQEFELSAVRLNGGRPYTGGQRRSVEIWIVVDGRARIAGEGFSRPLDRGEVVLVPARLPSYLLEGQAELYRATVPLDRVNS